VSGQNTNTVPSSAKAAPGSAHRSNSSIATTVRASAVIAMGRDQLQPIQA